MPLFLAASFGAPALWAYPYGVLPAGNNPTDAGTAYSSFKTTYFANDCSGHSNWTRVRINPGNSETYSEGMGYGMLMAAYLEPASGGQTVVQQLLNFINANLDARGLMNWHVSCSSTLGGNSAADGDLDIAFGLIVADGRWPGNGFGTAATNFLSSILSYETGTCGTGPGDAPGFTNCSTGYTYPSYFAPSYYTTFQCFTGNNAWATLKTNTYNQLAYWYSNYALPPEQIKMSSGQWNSGDYQYNSCRVPWRLSLDYLWNGNTTAQDQCQKIVTNFKTTDPAPSTMGDGYSYSSGAKNSGNHNAAFMGPAGDGAMVNSSNQSWLDSEYTNLKSLSMGSAYYQDAHKVISLMVQTGIFTDPCASGPTPTPTGTPTKTPTSTLTFTRTVTNTPTSTVTHTPTFTRTPTPTPTLSSTPTPTRTSTFTGTPTDSPTVTDSPTPTFTGQPTDTPTGTPTVTDSPTLTDTPTITDTPAVTFTFTSTPTDTTVATSTPTGTPTTTYTFTLTPSPTGTPTHSPTPTFSFTPTLSWTPTPTSPLPPSAIQISQPYSNPISTGTLQVDVASPFQVEVQWDVFTAAFRKIRSGSTLSSNSAQVRWDLLDREGKRVSSGIYYLRVVVEGSGGRKVSIKKVLVLQ
ncbi:MAG TPA: glycosyl hydrolase family 8 [bacterium]|nr:glycosyl hydrolase family 8 [bacterium]